MEIVYKGLGSDYLKELPKASSFLGNRAKHHYKRMGRILIGSNSLKSVHLPSLEVLAENLEQWEWAIKEIKKKNKEVYGSGYIQKYNSGAKNISVELTIKRDAEKAIMQCFKLFGLDPKSEKELKGMVDPSQGDLFNGFDKRKTY